MPKCHLTFFLRTYSCILSGYSILKVLDCSLFTDELYCSHMENVSVSSES